MRGRIEKGPPERPGGHERQVQGNTPLKRVLVWSPVGSPGAEYCEVARLRSGWRVRGSVIAVARDQPLRVAYRLTCASDWRTRTVQIDMDLAGERRALRLTARDGVWQTSMGERADLRGCVDVDLGVTPMTNTLPIRRLNLAVGASAPVTAAWVRFPSLEVRPLAQTYTRLAERTYRYESDTGFRAEIEVDDEGFVVDYPGGWRMHLPAQ